MYCFFLVEFSCSECVFGPTVEGLYFVTVNLSCSTAIIVYSRVYSNIFHFSFARSLKHTKVSDTFSDAGFTHSAFALGYEAAINKCPIDGNLVPPGALITFIQKGLQYLEMEANLNNVSKLLHPSSFFNPSCNYCASQFLYPDMWKFSCYFYRVMQILMKISHFYSLWILSPRM